MKSVMGSVGYSEIVLVTISLLTGKKFTQPMVN